MLPLLLAATAVAASGAAPRPPPPRLALVLGGGGARGIAHIGALQALEEAGIAVDAIAATSIGAIVGGIYATGRSPEELEEIVRSLDWAAIFSDRPDRRTLPVARHQDRYRGAFGVDLRWKDVRLPAGVLSEHRVNRFLIEYLTPAGYAAGGDFDRLPIRFRCVATRLDDGQRLEIANGDLARAVRASMSLPLAFAPIDWDGVPLVDGGVVDNLPVASARAMGAAVVVAVDVARSGLDPDEYEDAFGVASQVTHLLTARSNAPFASEPDVLVRPELGRRGTMEWSDVSEVIEAGRVAMEAALPQIRARLEAAGLATRLEPRAAPEPLRHLDGTPIAEVTVRGNERLSERLIRRTFNIPIGPGFITLRALRALDKVQASGLLDHAWMELEPVAGGVRVVLRVQEAAPNRLELGAGFTEWEKARGSIRLRNRNSLGFGEETELLLAGSDAEVVEALSLRGDRLLVPGLGYRLDAYSSTDKPRFYDSTGERLDRGQFERLGLGARLQVPLERWGLVEAGFELGRVRTVRRPGLELAEGTDLVRRLHASLTLDVLDDLEWPEVGERLALGLARSAEAMGAAHDYWTFTAEGRIGRRLGRRLAIQIDASARLSDGELPVYDQFRLGGPALLPGFHHEELIGPQALAAAAALRLRAFGPMRLFVRGGAGGVFPSRDAIRLRDLRWGTAVGALFPSRLGPMAVEVGVGDGGDPLVTLSLGWN